MGYLSVLVSELNINRLHQRNMLCCTEWYRLSSSNRLVIRAELTGSPAAVSHSSQMRILLDANSARPKCHYD